MKRLQKLMLAASLLICLFVFGCGGTAYTPPPADGLKPGPGLFSGEDGVFTLFSTGGEDQKEQKGDAKQHAAPDTSSSMNTP